MKVPMVVKSRSCEAAALAASQVNRRVNSASAMLFIFMTNPTLQTISFSLFLQHRIEILYRRFEHFITPFTNSFWRRLYFDVRLNADALQLAAIGVTHIVTGEVHI